MLDYNKPITTRKGSKVIIYAIYDYYMNGAWYNEVDNRWIPQQWTTSGFMLPSIEQSKQMPTSLDIINNEYYPPKQTKKPKQ